MDSNGKVTWKTQLREMAQQGKIPATIFGSAQGRAEVFREIDKLYSMPDTSFVKVMEQGDAVRVVFGRVGYTVFYPSRLNADSAEKRGVLKWLLLQHKK